MGVVHKVDSRESSNDVHIVNRTLFSGLNVQSKLYKLHCRRGRENNVPFFFFFFFARKKFGKISVLKVMLVLLISLFYMNSGSYPGI